MYNAKKDFIFIQAPNIRAIQKSLKHSGLFFLYEIFLKELSFIELNKVVKERQMAKKIKM